jgi:hypothetical protein
VQLRGLLRRSYASEGKALRLPGSRLITARPALALPDGAVAATLLVLIRTAIVGTVIAIQPVLMAV